MTLFVRSLLITCYIVISIPFCASALFGDDDAFQVNCHASDNSSRGHLRTSYIADLPDKLVYFRIDQGFSYGRMLDQRMSNLHYTGPGGVLSFARHVRAGNYISEIRFAQVAFHFAQPVHEGTMVYNPVVGAGYMRLQALQTRSAVDLHVGGQAELYGNMRMASSMGNSFLFSDISGQLKASGQASYGLFLFDRLWQFEFTLSAALAGYGIRLPEYGVNYHVADHGGAYMFNRESLVLHPGNYAHFCTGIYYKGSLGRQHNPNRFRIGYAWDYYSIKGSHDLNVYHASHQLVLAFYFLMN